MPSPAGNTGMESSRTLGPLPHRQRAGSLLEMLLLIGLILAFMLIAMDKIRTLRIVAERTGVETLVGTLRSTLGIELVSHVSRQGLSGIEKYHHSNPIRYVKPPPANYLGEFPGEPAQAVEGAWYFNTKEETLVYHVHFDDYLVTDNRQRPKLVRFQVQMSYRDRNNNGKYDPGLESPTALMLIALDNYHWISEDKPTDPDPLREIVNGRNPE